MLNHQNMMASINGTTFLFKSLIFYLSRLIPRILVLTLISPEGSYSMTAVVRNMML